MRTIIITLTLALAILGASACSDDSPEAKMRDALNDFTAELNAGRFDSVTDFYSEQCRSAFASDKVAETWQELLGEDAIVELTGLEVVSNNGSYAQVVTEFELTRGPDLLTIGDPNDPIIEWMVLENGKWRIHDKICEVISPRVKTPVATWPAVSTPSVPATP